MAAKAKEAPAPSFGAVTPPRRRRRGGFEIAPEVVEAIKNELQTAPGEGWVSDNVTYETMGKAQAASHRYRTALVDDGYIDEVKQIASRVWQGDGDNEYMFAMRLREEGEPESNEGSE